MQYKKLVFKESFLIYHVIRLFYLSLKWKIKHADKWYQSHCLFFIFHHRFYKITKIGTKLTLRFNYVTYMQLIKVRKFPCLTIINLNFVMILTLKITFIFDHILNFKEECTITDYQLLLQKFYLITNNNNSKLQIFAYRINSRVNGSRRTEAYFSVIWL